MMLHDEKHDFAFPSLIADILNLLFTLAVLYANGSKPTSFDESVTLPSSRT